MKIEFKHNPDNKSPYQCGDRIVTVDNNPENEGIVIGEDDVFLHTIVLRNGVYYGINKIANGGRNLEAFALLDRETKAKDGINIEVEYGLFASPRKAKS